MTCSYRFDAAEHNMAKRGFKVMDGGTGDVVRHLLTCGTVLQLARGTTVLAHGNKLH